MATGNRHDFLMLMQTIVLHERPPLAISISILDAAMSIPAEALPESVRDAAFQLWYWKMGREAKPQFLQDYEKALAAIAEEKKRSVVIKVIREHGGSQWWMHAEACSGDMPPACALIVTGRGVDSITVARRDAEAFHAWAKDIPGYDDGPPFTFHNVDGTMAFA